MLVETVPDEQRQQGRLGRRGRQWNSAKDQWWRRGHRTDNFARVSAITHFTQIYSTLSYNSAHFTSSGVCPVWSRLLLWSERSQTDVWHMTILVKPACLICWSLSLATSAAGHPEGLHQPVTLERCCAESSPRIFNVWHELSQSAYRMAAYGRLFWPRDKKNNKAEDIRSLTGP